MKRFLQCIGITAHSEEVVTSYFDSTAALAHAKDPKCHGKSKHKYHFIRDTVARGEVVMKHISTGSMVANPLTKPIDRDVFQSHVGSMGLRRMSHHYELYLTLLLLIIDY